MASRKSTSLFAGLFILVLTWRGGRGQVEVSMEDRVEVFLGDTAQITCMFTSDEGIGGIEIQWFLMQGETKQRIYYRDSTMEAVEAGPALADRLSVNVTGVAGAGRQVVLTVRDVTLQDDKTFICQIRTLDGSQEGRTRLLVFQTPRLPTIEGVDTGISVTKEEHSKIASCEVRNGYPRPNITWYRDLMPLRSDDGAGIQTLVTRESSGLYTLNSELQMKVVQEDQDARFYCEVSYFVPGGTKMTETPRVNITVHYPNSAVDIWIESPAGLVKEGDTVEIRCRGNGNPQPILTFFHNQEELQHSGGHVDRVELRDVTRLNKGVYQCKGNDQETWDDFAAEADLFVHYLDAAVLEPKDTAVMQLGEERSVTCNALSSLPTHTAWYKGGEQVAEGHVLKLMGGVATSGTYECVVTVPKLVGMETRGQLQVYVQAPPVLSEPAETVLEESVDQSVELSCHATGYPAPKLTWTSSDSQALKEVSHSEADGAVTSVVRVKVTSDLTVRCNASSQQGTVAKVFTIKATSAGPDTPTKRVKKEGSGVIIAVIIICILLLAILGSVLYFLYKKGKICGRSGKQDLTKEKTSKDNIVVEMKSDNTEDAVLLQGVNGEKKPPNDQ